MKYTKTAALACALLLCAGSVQAADKKQENVLPQRFSDAMTWNLQNRPEDITITKVAVPADHSSKGQPSGGNLPPQAGRGRTDNPVARRLQSPGPHYPGQCRQECGGKRYTGGSGLRLHRRR